MIRDQHIVKLVPIAFPPIERAAAIGNDPDLAYLTEKIQQFIHVMIHGWFSAAEREDHIFAAVLWH